MNATPRPERPRNVLFIMCDQLRADYLSCYGHPTLETPNIDRLARRGVRFNRAYVQSGVCGPSRMSFYTGRYPSTHGATWNFFPLPVGERTLGEVLESNYSALHLVGKTHHEPDREGMERLGIDPSSDRGDLLSNGGFRVVVRHEGDLPTGKRDYKAYLSSLGYAGEDPWLDYAVGAIDDQGETVSGWQMRHAHLPARVREEHSETAYATDRALEFIRSKGDQPWVLHLSYIKPHWPYVVPAPYHNMYRNADTGPILPSERSAEHPVVSAYRAHPEAQSFGDEAVARHVRPTYMGLIKQIDDHLGRLFDELMACGRMEDTLIVFTSDHGDFLGDRGLGEKELFYEEVQRVPLIVYDPSGAADATRGTAEDRMAEAVDVMPTVLEALGHEIPEHWVEGRSLLALIHGEEPAQWRDQAISELDYSTRRARHVLGLPANAECRGWMVRTERWKYVHWAGFRPQLFDLQEDPSELHDRGADPALKGVRAEHAERLLHWSLARKRRTGVDHARIERMTDNLPPGIHIGEW
ncbi:alkaline phosphatase family protein [Ectothiorhodospiraceae bacterium WFHF3C12]|nr:alkaline phosphatase family protein [Ectothiorhodospiraceae bacterium WFHF3C12]